ncbi:MAG: hypothetical protein K2Q18_03330 [Bdellovibrionales bacterium]|nr:hypothetical protein [Bdellovibrionales bacterium]
MLDSLKNRKLFLHLIVLTTLLCVFRIPFLSLFSLQKYSVVLNIIPLLTIMVASFLLEAKNKINKFLLALCIFSLSYLAFYLASVYQTHPNSFISVFRELSSTTLFLLFPLLLDKIFSRDEIEWILTKIIPPLVIIALTLTLSEFLLLKFKLVTIDEVAIWLTTRATTKVTRLVTFMGLGAISILSITAVFCYLFHKELKKIAQMKIEPYSLSMVILSFTTVLLSDSITLIFAMILVAATSIAINAIDLKRHHIMTPEFKKKLIRCSLIFAVIFVILFMGTTLQNRFMGYFFRGEFYDAMDIYFPHIRNCSLSTLVTSFPVLKNISLINGCIPGEFHSILISFRHGFAVQISWLLFILIPVFYFFKELKKLMNFPASFFGAVAFLIPVIHYSGIEIWGNNYLAAFFMILMMKEKIFLKEGN